MADTLLFRGGSTADVNSSATTVSDREIVIDTTTDEIVVNSSKTRTVMQDSSGNIVTAGDVKVGGTSASPNIALDAAGFYTSKTSNGHVNLNVSTGAFLASPDGNTATAKCIIDHDGTIDVIGSGTTSAPKIELNADGSAKFDFASNFQKGIRIFANGGHTMCEVNGTGANSSAFAVYDGTGGGYKVKIKHNGDVEVAGSVTANNTVLTSDQRFKENITPANPQLADIKALGAQLKNFDWNADAPSSNGTRFLGLIAQDVEVVCPGIVKTVARTKQGAELTPEIIDEEGNVTPPTYEELDDSYKAISHDALIMKLLGAVAELSAKVEALEVED